MKLIPAIIFWGIFVLVIFKVPYPEIFTEASPQQLLSFFIPLFLALSLTINLFVKNIPASLSISLGIIFLLSLKAVESLNLVTGILILVTVGLLVSYFMKITKRNLTKLPKIPKLTKLKKG